MNFLDVDLAEMFSLSVPLLEILIRGSATYGFLFLIFRFVVRRDIGAVGIADILILVIVADASQNAMSGKASSVADGMVLVSVLIGWNLFLDWLTFRFAFIRKLAEPAPLFLIKNGEMLRRNMRRELISEDELWSKLHEQGIESLEEVKNMRLESDGNISVVKRTQ